MVSYQSLVVFFGTKKYRTLIFIGQKTWRYHPSCDGHVCVHDMDHIKFTFSVVLPLVIKCLWSSLSLKNTEERPGPLPSPSGSANCNTLSFLKEAKDIWPWY